MIGFLCKSGFWEREIRCSSRSNHDFEITPDFYAALGQFLSYRLALESIEPERKLYLAVPLDTYQTFFQYEFTQTAIERYQLLLIVYDPNTQAITKWIE